MARFFAVMPTWMLVLVVFIVAVVFGLLVGIAVARGRGAPRASAAEAATVAPVRKALPPPENPAALNNLALLYKKQGNLEAAEPLLKRALEIKEKNFDPGHPSLAAGLKNYASVLKGLGREEEAAAYERRATTLPPARRTAAE
ncbi:MAG: tetratricopeptide repeat protein [Rhodospirillaceae bacterium]